MATEGGTYCRLRCCPRRHGRSKGHGSLRRILRRVAAVLVLLMAALAATSYGLFWLGSRLFYEEIAADLKGMPIDAARGLPSWASWWSSSSSTSPPRTVPGWSARRSYHGVTRGGPRFPPRLCALRCPSLPRGHEPRSRIRDTERDPTTAVRQFRRVSRNTVGDQAM
jgi:hypothetical protein